MTLADHFTIADIIWTGFAILLFPVFLIAPGYVLGWALDLAAFRTRTRLLRYLLSLCLSVALTPILVYLLERTFSFQVVWGLYSILWIVFLAMIALGMRRSFAGAPFSGVLPAGIGKPLALICAAWVGIVTFSLVDMQIGHKLYLSVVAYDYSVRSAAVSQLARAEWLPPSNPFFHPGTATPFRYHYFWFLMCSLPVRLTNGLIGPRHVLIAGVAWIGFALMATVALYLRFFAENGAVSIRRRTMVALGLLSITGLDIIPTLAQDARHLMKHRTDIFASIDWWNDDQVTGWLDSLLWVPHHVAGLIACLTAFLILWLEWQGDSPRVRWQAIAGAGLALASAGGLSVYVTFSFAFFLSVWTIVSLMRKNYRQFFSLAAVGLLTLLAVAPFALELAHAGSSGTSGQGASFMRLGVRIFLPAHKILYALHRDGVVWRSITDFILLPLNFWLELGVLMIAGGIKIRQWLVGERPFTPANFTGAVMVCTSLFICIFVRSNTINTNDLGIRGMLIVQFVLLLWATDVMIDWRSRQNRSKATFLRVAEPLLALSLILGVASNVYELILLRGYAVLTDGGLQSESDLITPGEHFAERAFYSREMYEWLDGHIPRRAVEQHDPFHDFDHVPGLYANRQIGLSSIGAGIAFGGDPTEVIAMGDSVRPIFEPAGSSPDVDEICRKWKIDYLIARSDDPVWTDKQSWVWKRDPIFSNAAARGFACGIPSRSQ